MAKMFIRTGVRSKSVRQPAAAYLSYPDIQWFKSAADVNAALAKQRLSNPTLKAFNVDPAAIGYEYKGQKSKLNVAAVFYDEGKPSLSDVVEMFSNKASDYGYARVKPAEVSLFEDGLGVKFDKDGPFSDGREYDGVIPCAGDLNQMAKFGEIARWMMKQGFTKRSNDINSTFAFKLSKNVAVGFEPYVAGVQVTLYFDL